jgi:hypothetical protein
MDSKRAHGFDDVPVPRRKRPRTSADHPVKERADAGALSRPENHQVLSGDRKIKKRSRRRSEVNNDAAKAEPTKSPDVDGAVEARNEDDLAEDDVPDRQLDRPDNDDDNDADLVIDVPESTAEASAVEPLEEGEGDLEEAVRGEESESSVEVSPDGWARLELSGRGLTGMLDAAGVRGVRVERWYNFPPASSEGRIRALVMLYKWGVDRGDSFKWNPSHTFPSRCEESSGGGPNDIMHINQIINSASATQAIVSALLNISESKGLIDDFDLGEELSMLRSFARPMPPYVRGPTICTSKAVRSAHAAAAAKFSAPSIADVPPEMRASEDFWMYTIFMPGSSGRWVYEMNGCADEACVLGAAETDPGSGRALNSWVDLALEPMTRRIEECRKHRVRFQLFSLHDNAYADEYGAVDEEGQAVGEGEDADGARSGGAHSAANGDGPSSSNDEDRGVSMESLIRRLKRRMSQIPELERLVATHNYDVFLIEMMKLMASRADLNKCIGQADAMNGDDNGSATSTH